MTTVGRALPPLSPSRGAFRRLAARSNLVPVYAEVAADLDTPPSAFLRLRPGPYAFLLESVEGGEKWARYSFLGSEPSMVFTAKGRRLTVRHADGRVETLEESNPFDALRSLLARFKPVPVPGLPRFQGGAVGFLSYDMIRHVERLPTLTTDDQKLPDAVFMFTDDRPAPPPRSPCRRWSRSWPWGTRASPRRWTRPPSRRGSAGRRSSSPPATPTRSCCRDASTPSCGPTRSRSIARYAPSTRRP